jgi:hypothetical protein
LAAFFAFFAFFAFLAMLPSVIPKLVQCKSTIDVHRFRIHQNCKIDTAGCEEGKRSSLHRDSGPHTKGFRLVRTRLPRTASRHPILLTDRCCSRHERGKSFGISFSSMVTSPSRAALVRSGTRKASRNPCRTTFGWRSAVIARASTDAWRPLDRSSSQAWARTIDFTSFWSIFASDEVITRAVPLGVGVQTQSAFPRDGGLKRRPWLRPGRSQRCGPARHFAGAGRPVPFATSLHHPGSRRAAHFPTRPDRRL